MLLDGNTEANKTQELDTGKRLKGEGCHSHLQVSESYLLMTKESHTKQSRLLSMKKTRLSQGLGHIHQGFQRKLTQLTAETWHCDL